MPLFSIAKAFWRMRQVKWACKQLAEAVDILEENEWADDHPKIRTVNKCLSKIRNIIQDLYAHLENRGLAEAMLRKLSSEFLLTGVFLLIIKNILKLNFEARKGLSELFVDSIYYSRIEKVMMAEKYFIAEKNVTKILLAGYAHPEVTMQCGFMLKEVLRFPRIAKRLLDSGDIYKLLELSDSESFGVCSEAFISFKCMMVWHTAMMSKYLKSNNVRFCSSIVDLLLSKNYAVRINATKLFIVILGHQRNFYLMSPYILTTEIFNALLQNFLSSSVHLQYLTFCIYKIILTKPQGLDILDRKMEYKDIVLHFILCARHHQGYTTRDKFLITRAYVAKEFMKLM